jgi:predicted amidohydrolase YtcJ
METSDRSGPADVIFHGGDIVTVDPRRPISQALAARHGRIVALGDVADVMKRKGGETRMIDLNGRALMPGFVDPHTHPLLTGLLHGSPTINISPFHVATSAEAWAKIKASVASAKPDQYLFFFGIEFLLYKGATPPSLRELDELAPDNPVVILTNNCHTGFGNSRAFSRAGITADTPNPPGGHFDRHASGNLTGRVLEFPGVLALLAPFLNEGGEDRRRRSLREQIVLHARAGYTTLADLALDKEDFGYYREYAAEPHPMARIRAYEKVGIPGATVMLPGSGDDWFKCIGVKLWADGSPYVGNIWVSQPYKNTPVTLEILGFEKDHVGGTNYAQQDLQKLVNFYYSKGWQVAIHAQGDRTLDMVLAVYDEAIAKSPRRDHRLRLEHCGALQDHQIVRSGELGVTVSFFPGHLYYYGDVLLDDLFAPEVAERWMPMGSALREGVRFSMHNDPPMTPPNALLNIQTAVMRKARGSGRTLGAAQRIGVAAAIRAQTIDAAYQLFMENEVGSLELGKCADFAVLSDNPLKVEPEAIAEIKIECTWVDGREAWIGTGL